MESTAESRQRGVIY